MFETLNARPNDAIIELMAAFAADERREKVDLGVGVYRDETGNTPIMRAISEASLRLVKSETTKAYVDILGTAAFREAMTDLVLAGRVASDRLSSCATVGGSGALRMAFELVLTVHPDARFFVPNSSWDPHYTIAEHLGGTVVKYPYLDTETQGVDFDRMMQSLGTAKAGDVILLHGCCHNPSGADLSLEQWDEVGRVCLQTGALPIIDLAYQGFGHSLDEDAEGLRRLANAVPECLIAASCSKNFGLYRERTGLLIAVTEASRQKSLASELGFLNRQAISFPPDYGARLVTTVLTDPALRATWHLELEEMSSSVRKKRQMLADALRARTGSDRFYFFAQHNGMFSLLGARPNQIEQIKRDHAIYMPSNGRMNLAGLTEAAIPRLVDAIDEAGI